VAVTTVTTVAAVAGPDARTEAALSRVFTQEWGRLVAGLIRLTGDWDLAEESVQDAFTRALERWPADGVPRNPAAWLTTSARNRALDVLRRRHLEADKLRQSAQLAHDGQRSVFAGAAEDDSGIVDDRLRLIFTCCHPALALDARIALTLRTLCGLTTGQIARAFLVPEATMAKRLTRAKSKIHHAGIPYRVPPAHLLPERTTGVMAVIYLMFNEGYAATEGDDLLREDLCAEAIRLARVLAELMPEEPEADALLALMLLHHARRAARTDDQGEIVTLEHQERSRWDHASIAEGVALLAARDHATTPPGPYRLQAAIAACHATAASAAETDWARIARLYEQLSELTPSAVVELNRAVALAMAYGPAVGLALTDQLAADAALDGYHLLPAVRADLLRRMGRREEAHAAYLQALALTGTQAERRFLERRLRETADESPAAPGT
jgi:RNA polymerase sigma-70 factor, ECF subfamily